jgi:hypothetical protein
VSLVSAAVLIFFSRWSKTEEKGRRVWGGETEPDVLLADEALVELTTSFPLSEMCSSRPLGNL